MKHKLELQPENRVTVVKRGKLEVVAGDHAGCVTIFWLKSETILRECKAHNTSVVDLEFDSIKIVSCGMDGCIKVIDFTSGEIIHTIRGEDGPILSCTFDESKIMSLTKDGNLRHWLWQSQVDPHKKGDIYHTVSKGETVAIIAKQYGISIVNLVKLNINQDTKNIQAGQKLIVRRKQEDSKSTTAEGTRIGNSKSSTVPTKLRPSRTKELSGEGKSESKTRFEPTLVASRLARSGSDNTHSTRS